MSRRSLLWPSLLVACAALSGAGLASAAPPPACAVIPLIDALPAPGPVADPRTPPVSRHRVVATLDPVRHTIRGRQSLTWSNPSGVTVCSLYLHLDLNAYAGWTSQYLDDRRRRGAAPVVRAGDWGYQRLTHLRQNGHDAPWIAMWTPGRLPTDRTLVRVDLPTPVAPGASTTLDIGFLDRLPGAWADIGHSGRFHLAAGWIPRVAQLVPASRTGSARWIAPASMGPLAMPRHPQDFDVTVTVPRGYSLVAGGVAAGRPLVRNNWSTHRFVLSRAADFAWAADPRFVAPLAFRHRTVGARSATANQGTPTRASPAPIRLRVFHRPEHATDAAAAAGAIADALGDHARDLAAYPTADISVVLVPAGRWTASGRAQAPGFVSPGLLRLSPGSEERMGLEASRAVGAIYFAGDAATAVERVLADGVVEYRVARRLRERRQPLRAWTHRLAPTAWLDAFAALRLSTDLRAPARDDRDAAVRVALALHDLEGRIGRSAMDRGIRAWSQGGRHDGEALHRALAHASGRPDEVAHVFADLARGRTADDRLVAFETGEMLPLPGYVEFRGRQVELTQAAIDRAVRRKREAWRRERSGSASAGPFPFRTIATVHRGGSAVPQILRVTFADGSSRVARWSGSEPVRHFQWLTRSPAVSAQLDPQRIVLLDRSKLDDGRAPRADTAPARRWGGDAAAAVQVASALLVGL